MGPTSQRTDLKMLPLAFLPEHLTLLSLACKVLCALTQVFFAWCLIPILDLLFSKSASGFLSQQIARRIDLLLQ